jgi:hypothetical protein
MSEILKTDSMEMTIDEERAIAEKGGIWKALKSDCDTHKNQR